MLTPIGVSYDYQLGYFAGQRLVKLSAYLSERVVQGIALHTCGEVNVTYHTDCEEYSSGMAAGYRDEISGLAHPLPAFLESEEV